jgi:hypothetical protein
MDEERIFVEQSDGEESLHKETWRVVERQIEHAIANPRGAQYDHLVAMVFAFHCIEGYLNFVGEKMADLWENERKNFQGNGVDKKLDVIWTRCGIAPLDRNKRPYSTIVRLKSLRDKIAHPKIIRCQGKIVEFSEDAPPPLFAPSYLAPS